VLASDSGTGCAARFSPGSGGLDNMVARRLFLASLVAATVAASASAAPARQAQAPTCARCVAPVFVVTGRGWGHGVGLAQWGAYGFARQGTGYEEILAHYYQGTELADAPVKRMRVLLAGAAKTLAVGSKALFRVRDGLGDVHELDAGTQKFGPGLSLRATGEQKPQKLQGPLVFLPGREPLELDKRVYRGELRVTVDKAKLRAINSLGLEPYLYGVVPSEMPHRWPAEALKAQAVAARSYALATKRSGDFDVYSDVRSQVYRGIPEEEAQTNEAIDATAGQVLTYGGKVARTYFFSSSGGRTATVTDVWPSSEAMPYLVAVDDPYDTVSPYHRWGPLVFTAKGARAKLKVPGPLRDLRTVVTPSGRVGSLVAVGPKGETFVSGADVRRLLGLRSTWFRVGVLALATPAAPVAPGGQLTLTGLARGLTGVTLEQRAPGEGWTPLAKVKPGAGGMFAIAVKPTGTTLYRLAYGTTVRSTPIKVPVSPSQAQGAMVRG
jgi:stage II sporulation protein D